MAQRGKNLPVMQETQVESLGRENPLEKGIVTHYSTICLQTNPCLENSMDRCYCLWAQKKLDMTEQLRHTHVYIHTQTHTHTHIYITDLLCCLETSTTL